MRDALLWRSKSPISVEFECAGLRPRPFALKGQGRIGIQRPSRARLDAPIVRNLDYFLRGAASISASLIAVQIFLRVNVTTAAEGAGSQVGAALCVHGSWEAVA